MKIKPPHILCINPWIHDFAAFDFWAKPIGLLSLAAILREQDVKVSYIDCLDRFHPQEPKKPKVYPDGRGPYRKTALPLPRGLKNIKKRFSRYGIDPSWFKTDLRQIEKPDLIFVTSMMTYWAGGVKETIDAIKEIYPNVPLVLGGIYASLCKAHAKENTRADLVVQGPGEKQLAGILKRFTGFDLDESTLPVEMDDQPYPAFELQNRLAYIPILTSRGCPFSCEYCASSFLEPEVRRRSPENVLSEIKHWYTNYGIKNFAFYDDALLVNAEKYAYPLFEQIIESGMALSFHTPNAVHINAITRKMADLMYGAGFKNIRLGLETADFGEKRHHDIKVKKSEFFSAVERLKSAGFDQQQLGAYLLCGLPGQNPDEIEYAMRLVIKSGIQPVFAYYTPIPHTPMWDDAVKKARYDICEHPVFTNNTLFPCVGSDAELKRISQLKYLKI